jgi:DNA-binding transcriptional regulator YhcF (GntR family)
MVLSDMITLDMDSPVPLIEQLVRVLRIAIASEELRPGAELPPVRQLASDLDINLNTVARAYRLLQDRGLVHTARGRGTRVSAATETPTVARRLSLRRLSASVGDTLADAKLAGVDAADVGAVLDEQFELFWGKPVRRRA